MNLYFPLKTYMVNQPFGADPVPTRDTWYGDYLVKAGQHVYQILAKQIGHNGIDLGAPRNEPIYAIHGGWIIERVGRGTGYGLRIGQRFEADGRSWLAVYGHMDHFKNPDEFDYNWRLKLFPVKAGEVIGYVDSTGASTGEHLHLSLYVMNDDGSKFLPTNGFGGAIDPMPYLQGDFMVYFAHIAGTQEYGFVEETPFTKVYNRGTNESDIKFMAAKFGLNVTKADGTIDFTRAKDITI